MRAILILVALAGCGDTAALEERVAKLETRATEAEKQVARLTKNDEAIVKTTADHLADAAGRLLVAGIADEKGRPIVRWWCSSIGCARTKPDCELVRTKHIADHQYDKRPSTPGPCEPRRVSYCGSNGCFDSFDFCMLMTKNGDAPNVCNGVE